MRQRAQQRGVLLARPERDARPSACEELQRGLVAARNRRPQAGEGEPIGFDESLLDIIRVHLDRRLRAV